MPRLVAGLALLGRALTTLALAAGVLVVLLLVEHVRYADHRREVREAAHAAEHRSQVS